MKNNPNMQVCLKNKKIFISRFAIAMIGNPTHLILRYDEQGGILYFSSAKPDDLDAYEIPKFYWTGSRKCEIRRIAFLKALQYRLGWDDGGKYYFDGKIIKKDNGLMLVYMLTEGKRIR